MSAERPVRKYRWLSLSPSAIGIGILTLIPIQRRVLESQASRAERDLERTRIVAPFDLRVVNLEFLRASPSNRLEQLHGDRDGQWSIRINDQWRVCFRWEDHDAYEVEVTDYH